MKSLAELAALVSGEIKGDSNIQIRGFNALNAASKDEISILYRDEFVKDYRQSSAAAVITAPKYADLVTNAVICADPKLDFIKIIAAFSPPKKYSEFVAKSAVIGKNTTLGSGCHIKDNVVIGADCVLGENCVIHSGVVIEDNCEIGADTLIYPNVTLYSKVKLGANVIVHANTVIGSDGFGFVSSGGKHHKIPHVKSVIIEDEVEIGACVTIDRGYMLDTKIGLGTKLDNNIHIAHNCIIGKYNFICASSSIAGSSQTGDYVIIGGNGVVSDNVKIGDSAVLGGFSCLIKDAKDNTVLYGFPARPKAEWLQKQAKLNKLLKKV